MQNTLHIIEPTLNDETGHCYSFNRALCHHLDTASQNVFLWLNRQARLSFPSDIQLKPYFSRKLRRLQLFRIIQKLLGPGKAEVFIPTCTLTDLQLLSLTAARKRQECLTVYVHWFKPKPKRLARLKRVAGKLNDTRIFVPTETIRKIFSDAGFKRVSLIPYPIEPSDLEASADAGTFEKLLYSGAARLDKGFYEVSAFLNYLEQNQKKIPISIQTSSTHSGSIPPRLAEALSTVSSSTYPHLATSSETLGINAYYHQFKNAISLMFYDVHDFDDRISGVALDSLSMGAPIICNDGHWIARQVKRYNAGLVLPEVTNETINQAAEQIIGSFAEYARGASEAGKQIMKLHNPDHLARAVQYQPCRSRPIS